MAGLGKGKRPVKKVSVVAQLAGKNKNDQISKSTKVDKHYQLDGDLYERFRLYCFENRIKERAAIQKALDEFLTGEGY